MFIDPPSGWKYGFPKPFPSGVEDVRGWLLENGYPKKEADKWPDGIPCGMWEDDAR